MNCSEVRARVHAYIDRELDPLESARIAKHLNDCSMCAALYERTQALSTAVRTQSSYFRAPAELGEQLRSQMRQKPAGKAWYRVAAQGRQLGAAALLGALLAWQITLRVVAPRPPAALQEVVSDHVRALMTHQLTAVTSSDQHTVKPWFDGRVDFAPPVQDFADRGFPLVGGRLDFIDGHPVAVLVYRHLKHIINVFVWPLARGPKTPHYFVKDGYHVAHWARGGMTFWAVSDMDMKNLHVLAGLLLSGKG